MAKHNIKTALLDKERAVWVKVNSILLHFKNLVDKRLQIIYNYLDQLETTEKDE